MEDSSQTTLYKIATFLINSRYGIVALFLVITVFMMYAMTGLSIETGFKKQLPLKHEYMQTFLQYEKEFGGANRILVALIAKDGNMFDAEFFQSIEEITDQVFFIPGVDRASVRGQRKPYADADGGDIHDLAWRVALIDAAGVRRRRCHAKRNEHLGRRQCVRLGAGEEFQDRQLAGAVRPGDLRRRVEYDERRRRVGGRGRVGDIASDCGHVARLDRADDGRSLRERAEALARGRKGRHGRHVDAGSYAQPAPLVDLDAVQLGQGVEADDRGGVQASLLHLDEQVRAAGEELDAVGALLKERHRFGQRLGGKVLESVHGAPPL